MKYIIVISENYANNVSYMDNEQELDIALCQLKPEIDIGTVRVFEIAREAILKKQPSIVMEEE